LHLEAPDGLVDLITTTRLRYGLIDEAGDAGGWCGTVVERREAEQWRDGRRNSRETANGNALLEALPPSLKRRRKKKKSRCWAQPQP
jgi:hypothetical protein